MKILFFLLQLLFLSSNSNLFAINSDDLLIKREIRSISESQLDNLHQLNYNDNKLKDIDYLDPSDSLKSIKILENDENSYDLEHYGYDYFSNFSDRLILNNLPPLDSYKIGPGDELIVEVWGDVQLKSNYIIDKYGKVNIDKIGQVYLTGITVQNIKQKLIDKFINVYSTLGGAQPTSFLDISLGKLKSVNISFIGEVKSPGIHPLNSHSTIITSLVQIGGVKKTGSLRDIQVLRNGKVITNFDFYSYLSTKGVNSDIRLLDGDVIFIPVRLSSIQCQGNIKRPGIYELLPSENLSDIINHFGGIKSNAKSILSIHRLTDKEIPAKTYVVDINSNADFVLKDGDKLEAYKIQNNKHEVFLYGQVKNPGSYPFDTESEVKLLDILRFSGFLDDPTYLQTVYKDVGEVIRNYPDLEYPTIIKFNLDNLLSGNEDENIILNNWDIILIRENPNFKFPSKVSLLGEVNVPGIYSLQKKQESLQDVLKRAGGLTDEAFDEGLKLYRNNNQIALNNYNIFLIDGDSIIVPEHPGVVKIKGEVNRPGLVQYEKRKSFSSYIESAGGYTNNADKNNITVIYSNGEVRIKKKLRKPNIHEGVTIIVHKQKTKEEFSLTELSTNFASLLTSLATLILLMGQI